jgi:hypothetical protein
LNGAILNGLLRWTILINDEELRSRRRNVDLVARIIHLTTESQKAKVGRNLATVLKAAASPSPNLDVVAVDIQLQKLGYDIRTSTEQVESLEKMRDDLLAQLASRSRNGK